MGVLFPDSKFYRGLSTATDLVIVNLLTLTASIPVVTMGAALTACARVCGETVREENGYLVHTWWAAFCKNPAQSMGWWIPCVFLLGAGAAESWFLSSIDDSRLADGLNGLLIVGLAAVLGVLSWIAPLQALFENTIIGHVGNAAVLAGGCLWRTLANVAAVLAPLAVFAAVPQARMVAIWFVAIIGVAFTAHIQAIVEEAALDKLLEAAHNQEFPILGPKQSSAAEGGEPSARRSKSKPAGTGRYGVRAAWRKQGDAAAAEQRSGSEARSKHSGEISPVQERRSEYKGGRGVRDRYSVRE